MRLKPEPLEPRRLLTTVGFERFEIFSSEANVPTSDAVDIDGDGDLDVLVGSRGKVSWYENLDGKGAFGSQRFIATSARQIDQILAADIDRDGDGDVVVVSYRDSIYWLENADDLWQEHQIAKEIGITGSDGIVAFVADIDRDNDLDVLFSTWRPDTRRQVVWVENSDGLGRFTTEHVVATREFDAMELADFDADGDLDFVGGATDGAFWYTNSGNGDFSARPTAVARSVRVRSLRASDVDRDGDIDLVSGSRDAGLVWFENQDGQGSLGKQHVVASDEEFISETGDVDGDGDVDLISGGGFRGPISWRENMDGKGDFGEPALIAEFLWDGRLQWPGTQRLADLDGDGDLDLLWVDRLKDEVQWHEFIGDERRFGPKNVITRLASPVAWPSSLAAADLDEDGDQDLISTSDRDGRTAWYENRDGQGDFGPQQVVFSQRAPCCLGVQRALTGDLDNDGDIDLISLRFDSGIGKNIIDWHQNDSGTFRDKGTIVEFEALRAHAVPFGTLADLNQDGEVDVISASLAEASPGGVFWHEGIESESSIGWQMNEIDIDTVPIEAVEVGDVDGDQDLDIVASLPSEIVWYENQESASEFIRRSIVTIAGEPRSNSFLSRGRDVIADIDGDGDLDVVYSTSRGVGIAWSENIQQRGVFEDRGTIQGIHSDFGFIRSIAAADMDHDGDVDILYTSTDGIIAWLENVDDSSMFASARIIERSRGSKSLFTSDVDGDGYLDVLSTSEFDDGVTWYKNRLVGDTNGDGEVEFADFSLLAAAFGKTGASWSDGDFDSDGVVSFNDFVLLTQNFGQKRLARLGTLT